MSNYLDSKGYPVCAGASFDGGDCAADLGTLMALTTQVLPPIPWDDSTSQPLRYWDATKWSGLPNRFSRDQLTPMLCGFAARIGYADTLKFFEAHKRRWFLAAWNTLNNDGSAKSWPASLGDPCGPEVWALWIRVFNPWWAVLVLWLLDLQTLIGAIQWRWFKPESAQLTRNHMLVSITMMKRRPSPVSYLVNWINDWPDLIARWRASNEATQEFPTWDLFRAP